MFSLKYICLQASVLLTLLTAIQAIIVPQPVALYPLNSKYTTREVKNRQPQGNAVGVSLAAGPDGKPGGSYQFFGSANSYIEFPNNGGLDVTHSITLLCWVYPQNRDGPIFNYLPTGWNWGVHMWMVWGKLFARYTHRNYVFTPHLLSAQPPTLNQWHYMGTTYDHTTGVARLWLDGQKAAELNIGANMMLATQDNVRMGVKSGDPRYFKGRISAMQVYNKALTPEQINEVKNAGRVDICEEQKPCLNGGKCENSGDSYICKCAEGFQGKKCETDINECLTKTPCQNGAQCKNTIGGYECICKPGFTGTNCETDIDDCEGVVCYNGGSCIDQVNGYKCECTSGHIGDHCEWEAQGCYKEVKNKKDKAMGKTYAQVRKFKKDVMGAVKACLAAAEKNQLQIFGVKSKYKCTTTKGSADFRRHGESKNCKKDGDYSVGVKKANFVYILKKEA